MRDDLLDARAAIDWAISDLPILEEKIIAWRNANPFRLRADLDSQSGKKIIRLYDVKPIPAIITAEAGVIIHAIRSSLDLLTVALAERNGHGSPTDTYFPIWDDSYSLDDLLDPATKKIKRLSAADQATIKNLQPYEGGNYRLVALHKLDSTRKHRHLLSVVNAPCAIIMPLTGVEFTPVWEGFKDNAIVATGPANASECDLRLELEIRLTEPRIVSRKPLIKVLDDFARLAILIIKLFDTPR
jgi:hypothetical protein